MGSLVEIQIAKDAHAEGISQVICDAIRRVNAADYPPAEIDRLVGNFTTSRILERLQERLTIVALSGEKVVGTGSLIGSQLKSIFVSPDFQRRGIGRLLVAELERVAFDRGVQNLTVSSSLSAVEFYTSLGYAEQRRTFYGDEETVVMTKPRSAP